jgi:hypothetical protein
MTIVNLRIKHTSQAAVKEWADKQIEKPTSANYIAVLLNDENCEKQPRHDGRRLT